jgi:hypothetical protein
MKITPKILKELGCEKLAVDSFILKSHGYEFSIKKYKDLPWTFNGHSVTDVEEMIALAYKDGFQDGQVFLKKQLREMIGCWCDYK